ncbi:MAG: acetate kinase [Pseudoxanthomonas sp.]
MKRKDLAHLPLLPVACLAMAICGAVRAQELAPDAGDSRLDGLQKQINEQTRQLDDMRNSLQAQEQNLVRLQQALNEEILANARARGLPAPTLMVGPMQVPLQSQGQSTGQPPGPSPAQVPAYAQNSAQQQPARQPVGQAPESEERPPEVAQIFDQPGVLTPSGTFVLEPSLQYGYSSNDRVALVGYTVIPAILIGLIDVRQVKTTSAMSVLTARYGLSKRFEMEAKLPYVYINGDTVSREVFTGSAVDRVFNASGSGIGDVEVTARYQLNRGGPDKPYYVAWLRYKSRTGTDLFEVVTDCVTRCIGNTTGTGLPLELPTGTGFDALQPGVTWLFPSDPVVFFGSLSYLHNFKRSNVSRTVINGQTEFLGDIEAGDIIGFNLGMGLALNEKAAISIGYDQNTIGKTKQNGQDVAGAVRISLATLLLGGTYRFNDNVSLNVALGAGLTRDTPDVNFTVRVPVTF